MSLWRGSKFLLYQLPTMSYRKQEHMDHLQIHSGKLVISYCQAK